MANFIIEPEFLVDLDGRIKIGPITVRDGKVVAIGSADRHLNATTLRLPNQVLMHGFINCHSHAFQRALRGLTERGSQDQGQNNFWRWREKMYRIVQKMTKDDFYLLAHLAYLEMLEAGFSHVGEFHYVHHDLKGAPFNDPLTMSKALVKAAQDTNINLCLLECAYQRHSFNEPLREEQRRFGHSLMDNFLALVLKAHQDLSQPSISVGVAIHSVRAVPEEWFSPIQDLATALSMPLHLHTSEQKQEVDDCLKQNRVSPIALLRDNHLLTPATTLVHATHLINDDIDLLVENRPNVCICPSTEKNLGDGMIPLEPLYQAGVKICIGTDQHVRFDPFDEARSLEEIERLRLLKRGILTNNGAHLYEALLPCLTANGLGSLYPHFNATSLLNQDANLISIELPPEYLWHGPHKALDAMMLAHQPSKILNVMVNGRFVVQDGISLCQEKAYIVSELCKIFHEPNG
jgi:formimidoylglutamate deiminase